MSKNAYQDFHGTLNRSFQLKIVTHRCPIPPEKREQVLLYTSCIFVANTAILSYCAGDSKIGGLNLLQITLIKTDWFYK